MKNPAVVASSLMVYLSMSRGLRFVPTSQQLITLTESVKKMSHTGLELTPELQLFIIRGEVEEVQRVLGQAPGFYTLLATLQEIVVGHERRL